MGKISRTAPTWTHLDFLAISENYDPRELIAELKSLDPSLLIFLRKLRQVNLMIFNVDGSIWRSTLRHHDLPFGNGKESAIELWHNTKCSSLKKIVFPVHGHPPGPKRPGCTQVVFVKKSLTICSS